MKNQNDHNNQIEESLTGQFQSFALGFEIAFGSEIPLNLKVAELPPHVYARYEPGLILFNLAHQRHEIEAQTFAHETAHWLCAGLADDFLIPEGRGHTFEFGVLCALLTYRLGIKRKNLFRSYDFHEDRDYQWLTVNPHHFDQLIASTPAHSLDELCSEAIRVAHEIRHQAFLTKYELDVAAGGAS